MEDIAQIPCTGGGLFNFRDMDRKEFLSLVSMTPLAFMFVSPNAKELAIKEDVHFKSDNYKKGFKPSDFECLLKYNNEPIALLKGIKFRSERTHLYGERYAINHNIEFEYAHSDNIDKLIEAIQNRWELDAYVITNETEHCGKFMLNSMEYKPYLDTASGELISI